MNLIKLSQSIYNFIFQLKHSFSFHEDVNNNNNQDHDQRMIKKLYLNHIFVISQKALDIMYVLMLMRAGGGLNLNFFPLA